MYKLLLGIVAASLLALATPASANYRDWCWYHPYDWRCQRGPSVSWGWWGWNNWGHNNWNNNNHWHNNNNNWHNNNNNWHNNGNGNHGPGGHGPGGHGHR
jgi:hypothetical protein